MKKWFNPEIAFGFTIGVLTLLFLMGVSSYQMEHCREVNYSSDQEHTDTKRDFTKDNRGDAGVGRGYDKSHPVSCGIIGFPSSIVKFSDENEGFFVGLFTLALVIVTAFLWRSTDKLWETTQEQIKISGDEFNANHRPKIIVRNIKLFDLRQLLVFYEVINVGDSQATPITYQITILRVPADGTADAVGSHRQELRKFAAGERQVYRFKLNSVGNEFDAAWDHWTGSLKIKGTIRYKDARGIERETGFGRTYDDSNGRFVPSDDPDEEYVD